MFLTNDADEEQNDARDDEVAAYDQDTDEEGLQEAEDGLWIDVVVEEAPAPQAQVVARLKLAIEKGSGQAIKSFIQQCSLTFWGLILTSSLGLGCCGGRPPPCIA